jgi:hypothetical protein
LTAFSHIKRYAANRLQPNRLRPRPAQERGDLVFRAADAFAAGEQVESRQRNGDEEDDDADDDEQFGEGEGASAKFC